MYLYSWSAFCRNVVLFYRQFLPIWSNLSTVLAPVTIYCVVISRVTATMTPSQHFSWYVPDSLQNELLLLTMVVESDPASSIPCKLLCWDIQLNGQFLQHRLGILRIYIIPFTVLYRCCRDGLEMGDYQASKALPAWFSWAFRDWSIYMQSTICTQKPESQHIASKAILQENVVLTWEIFWVLKGFCVSF